MFWPDVVEIRHFYDTTLGAIAREVILQHIHLLWKDLHPEETTLGIGYPLPFLNELPNEGGLACALMPAAQGVVRWPPKRANRSLLGDEIMLPFADNTINRVFLMHALENTDAPQRLMAEVTRVLVPGGKLVVVVPNRRGIWSRIDTTPFGYGRPYSRSQLRQLLRKHELTPTTAETLLYLPPTTSPLLQKLWRLMESVGRQAFGIFGGLVMMEGEKLLYAPTGKLRVSEPVRATSPATQPAMGFKG